MYTSKAFKIMILVAVCSAAAFGADAYLLSTIQSKNRYIAFVGGESATASEKEAKIARVKADVKAHLEDKAYLDSRFVDGSNIAGFFGEIEDLGRQAGVAVEIGTADFTKDKVKKLKLYFTASGTFDAMYRFVGLFENFRYEFSERRISLSSNPPPSSLQSKGKAADPVWKGEFEVDLISLSAK